MKKSRIFYRFICFCLTIFLSSAFFCIPVDASDYVFTSSFSERKTLTYVLPMTFAYETYLFQDDLREYFISLDEDAFYRIDFEIESNLGFTSPGCVNSYGFNLEIYSQSGDGFSRLNLIDQTTINTPSSNSNHVFIDSGYFIFHASDLEDKFYALQFGFMYGADAYDVTYDCDTYLRLSDAVKLSDSEAEIYQRAYDAGYADGEEIGFADGKGAGQAIGESIGYEYGFSDGYAAGESEGYDEGYDVGFSSGQNSVDTDAFYDSGYSAGVESVDTDSFYNAGYQAGLDAGYQDAYKQGYDEGLALGYSQGYSAAKEDSDSNFEETLTGEGDTFTISDTLDINKSSLTYKDANTLLDSTYEFEYIADTEYRDIYDSALDSAEVIETSEGLWHVSFYNDYQIESTIEVDEFSVWRGWFYYYTGRKKLFTADTSAYAYKIMVVPYDVSCSYKNVEWARHTVGTWDDIASGESDIGIGFSSGYSDNFTYFVETNNLPVDIYSAVLMKYYNEGIDNKITGASFDINAGVYYEITPYSRNEYRALLDGIDDLQDGLDQNFNDLKESINNSFDDLMHSYDDTAGNDLNNDFKASVTDYQTSETSLFNAAQDGLEGFEFVDFSSFPALVTSMSFVTSLMNSVYMYMGGETGPFGIVLSVLFSVMLVSMVIGLYRFYQNHKGG